MKKWLAVLLCAVMLLGATASAEQGILRMIPQDRFVSTNMLTRESCPNAVLTPYSVYDRFTACTVKPNYLTFPLPEGTNASDFKLSSVHALNTTTGDQYTYQITNDYAMEDLLIKCDNDADILYDGTNGVGAYIDPDADRAYALVGVSGFEKRTRVHITVNLSISRNTSAEKKRTMLTEAIEAEIARVQGGTVAASDIHWTNDYQGIRMPSREYDYVDLMVRFDNIQVTCSDGKKHGMFALSMDDDSLTGMFWVDVRKNMQFELSIGTYSYVDYQKKENPEAVHEYTLKNGMKANVYVPFFSGPNNDQITYCYVQFLLSDKAGRNHNENYYMEIHFDTEDMHWESEADLVDTLDEFMASFQLTTMDDDPYVPGPVETVAPATAAPAQQPANAQTWICPTCGQENEGNFCPNDATARPKTSWICPTCGQENEGNFCPNDGTARP